MMTLGQKVVAIGTIFLMNVVFFVFMGALAIIPFIASVPFALFLLTR